MKKHIDKIINVIIVLIVIGLYVAAAMFIFNDFRERKRKEMANGIIDKVDEVITDDDSSPQTEVSVNYNGVKYTVLGKITIKKIGIYQPILKENTKGSYNTALVKMAGPNLNAYGNVSIGGHNFMNGNYFIKIKRLVNNDVVTITDLLGTSINYYVYEYGVTSTEDASYLAQPSDKNVKIVTLVTCTVGGKERYYVKAKAK